MNRHAFRSVCSRTRPELEQASDALRNYVRQFHATQLQAAEDQPNNPSRSLRERGRAAASEINSMTRGRGSGPSRPAQGPQNGGQGGPKVIDVRSLPRAPRGLGGLRGRGGFAGRGGARGGAATTGPAGGFIRSGSPTRGGPGGFRGRGGLRGRGAGRGRGRGGQKRPQTKRPQGDDAGKDQKRGVDPFSQLDSEEQAFDDAMRFGVESKYSSPSLTLDSISDFAPIVPSSTTGQNAAVLQNLSALGGDDVGSTPTLQAYHFASQTERHGIRFFADVKDKEAAEQHLQLKKKQAAEAGSDGATTPAATEKDAAAAPIIGSAEEAVRKVIVQRAVQGQYEAPKFASDPVGVSRSWHIRAETYTTSDVNSFESKLYSLLSGKRPPPPSKAGGAREAKA